MQASEGHGETGGRRERGTMMSKGALDEQTVEVAVGADPERKNAAHAKEHKTNEEEQRSDGRGNHTR